MLLLMFVPGIILLPFAFYFDMLAVSNNIGWFIPLTSIHASYAIFPEAVAMATTLYSFYYFFHSKALIVGLLVLVIIVGIGEFFFNWGNDVWYFFAGIRLITGVL